ncbi:HAD family phosphatase [Corynebacterium sp. TAE3-ERU12]|uniref:HAD family hydrolase n=1 Tax=Corynebacterium sp. TAE3-ERU12 TaxID=2849491 RepID=UPI0021085C4D|nr:HAD family phosphatase [Corynebacterium sp. TAE3-ERU12]
MDALLWDMDGTLIDSEPLWGSGVYRLSEELGGRLPDHLRQTTIGGSAPHTVSVIENYLGLTLTDKQRERAGERLFELFLEALSAGAPMRPGTQNLLAEAKAAGIPQILVTNTVRRVAVHSLEQIGPDWFDGVLFGDDVAHGKPAPDIYAAAAAQAGTTPQRCLAIEDSRNGATAAVAAGCVTIAAPVDDEGDIAEGASRLSDLTGDSDFGRISLQELAALYDRLATAS